MIPTLLIVGAAVRGAKVKRVVGLQILLDSESDADEPTRFPTGSRRQRAGNLRLDHSIREVKALDPDQPLSILLRALNATESLFGDRGLQPLFALQHGRLGSYVVEPKTLDGFERVALGLR
jgi:hypothetical protein